MTHLEWYDELYQRLVPTLEKFVSDEVSPRRQALACYGVMDGEPPEVLRRLALRLKELAPEAFLHASKNAPISLRGYFSL